MLSLQLCAGGRKTSNNNTNNIARKVILIKKTPGHYTVFHFRSLYTRALFPPMKNRTSSDSNVWF